MTTRKLITIPDAADYLGVNPRTIRRRITDGTLTGYRMGPRIIRVDLEEVDALLVRIPPDDITAQAGHVIAITEHPDDRKRTP